MQIKVSNYKTDEEIIRGVMAVEEDVYPADMRGNFDNICKRFAKFPDMLIYAEDGGRLVGYLCYFPISDSLYETILTSDILQDDNILPRDVMGWEESKHVYIISIAVMKEYQRQGVATALVKKFSQIIKEHTVVDILTTAIIPELAQRYGAEIVNYADGYPVLRFRRY